MFDEYDPIKGRMLQVMDSSGNIIRPDRMPEMSDAEVVDAYKLMLYARVVDTRAVSYQRQGRMYTYPPNIGQEASALGTGLAMRKQDWLVPAYRELGAWLHKGADAKDIYLFWGGHEIGGTFPNAPNMFPPCVPIASQFLHAVGIGYGLKYRSEEGIVFTYIGDGGTSEGDFHEALNFAGVWKVPVIFVCQNNQYAISLPRSKQTASSSIAVKSIAYGIQGIQVDGNDFFATYAATQAAVESIESGGMPVLIETVTYRVGAHTTSDDPSRYRSEQEEREWHEKDPLHRLRLYLEKKGLWDQDQEKALEEQYARRADEEFTRAEQQDYPIEDVFRHMYVDLPEDLQRQQISFEKYLNWKEGR